MSQDYPTTALEFSPDSRYLASASESGHAILWHVADGTEVMKVYHTDKLDALAFSSDGRFLATLGRDDMVILSCRH